MATLQAAEGELIRPYTFDGRISKKRIKGGLFPCQLSPCIKNMFALSLRGRMKALKGYGAGSLII